MKMTSFKGKVYVRKNVNGKEEEFEREFNDPREYNDFIDSYQHPFFGNSFGLGERANIQNYFNNLIDRRFGLANNYNKPDYEDEEDTKLPDGINLDMYESELQKIEYEKAHKSEEIQKRKDALAKLKEYKKRFKAEGRDDMVEKIDVDIAKVQSELDSLEK